MIAVKKCLLVIYLKVVGVGFIPPEFQRKDATSCVSTVKTQNLASQLI